MKSGGVLLSQHPFTDEGFWFKTRPQPFCDRRRSAATLRIANMARTPCWAKKTICERVLTKRGNHALPRLQAAKAEAKQWVSSNDSRNQTLNGRPDFSNVCN
jgi:hypothetical protein